MRMSRLDVKKNLTAETSMFAMFTCLTLID